jgi:hypothetical protein
MKKKIPELNKEYDNYMKENLMSKGLIYLGSSPSILATCPNSYNKLIEDIERELLHEKINCVK